ncbi:hypothetical protein PS027_23495, partial [Shigella sonnei]|nr:hypothetical protein [Shigella sonnei]
HRAESFPERKSKTTKEAPQSQTSNTDLKNNLFKEAIVLLDHAISYLTDPVLSLQWLGLLKSEIFVEAKGKIYIESKIKIIVFLRV